MTVEIGKAERKAPRGVRQRDVFPAVGQRRAGVIGACRAPCRVIRVARPVVAGELPIARLARLKEKRVRAVEGGETKQSVLERSFEIAIVAGRREERSGHARAAGILM